MKKQICTKSPGCTRPAGHKGWHKPRPSKLHVASKPGISYGKVATDPAKPVKLADPAVVVSQLLDRKRDAEFVDLILAVGLSRSEQILQRVRRAAADAIA